MAKDNGQQQTYGKCQLNRWQSQFQTNDQRAAARMCGIVHMYTTFGTAINRIFAPIFSLILFPAEHICRKVNSETFMCLCLQHSKSKCFAFHSVDRIHSTKLKVFVCAKRILFIIKKKRLSHQISETQHSRCVAYVNICKNSDLINCCDRHFNVQM